MRNGKPSRTKSDIEFCLQGHNEKCPSSATIGDRDGNDDSRAEQPAWGIRQGAGQQRLSRASKFAAPSLIHFGAERESKTSNPAKISMFEI